jgi:hypothetical protein
MTVLRALTEVELEWVKSLIEDGDLTIEGACHSFYYYGWANNKEDLSDEAKENYKNLNRLLKKVIPDFVSFSNFTPEGTLRYQYSWTPDFTGVGYCLVEDLLETPTK